jgi:chloramphenicol-sensitive protein RarD
MKKGILYAIGAYSLWGLFPIYWKFLHHVPAVQIIGHRITWSFILLIIVILFTKQLRNFRLAALKSKIFLIYSIAAILLTINWFIYVWSVNSEKIIETSLGYFINPLLSVLLGVIFLRERLRPIQWIPIGLAAVGVIYLTIQYGQLPWIALSLAFAFALYGLVKKLAPLGSLFGLTLETAIAFPFAIIFLVFLDSDGSGSFLHIDSMTNILLIGTGAITSIPLLLFASAARQIPLTMVGILQYIAPTLQFFIGIFLYNEHFSHSDMIGFGLVWLALIIFWLENYFTNRMQVNIIPELGED